MADFIVSVFLQVINQPMCLVLYVGVVELVYLSEMIYVSNDCCNYVFIRLKASVFSYRKPLFRILLPMSVQTFKCSKGPVS